MKIDAVLIERELSLTKKDVADILNVLPDGETFIPLEIEGEGSSAMGFITYNAAERVDFMLDKEHHFYQFISEILDDTQMENPLCVYDFEEITDMGAPLKVLLTRDLPTAIARLNQRAIGAYCLSNTAAIYVHELDPWGEWVVVSLDGEDMQVCKITQAEKDDSASADDVETGFYLGQLWIPMSEVMRI